MLKKFNFLRGSQNKWEVEVSETRGFRHLYLGSRTIQSSMKISDPFSLVLDYTQAMIAFMLFDDRIRRVACIGLGGGSIPKFLWKYLPEINVCVVENSLQVINVARQLFALPSDDERLSVMHGDGMVWINDVHQYDVIMLDAFDGAGVPDGFTEEIFIQKVKRCLTHRGINIQNLWSNDPLLKSRINQIESHFEQIVLIPTPKGGNIVALAFCKMPAADKLSQIDQRAKILKRHLGIDFDAILSKIRSFQSTQTKKLLI